MKNVTLVAVLAASVAFSASAMTTEIDQDATIAGHACQLWLKPHPQTIRNHEPNFDHSNPILEV